MRLPAKKSLGQNFLRDADVIRRIVTALDLKPSDTVVEIGPGRGALTEELLETGATVIAIEIDRRLVPELRSLFGSHENFQVIEADVLETDLTALIGPQTAKVAANLPYYISTAILQKLIAERHAFSRLLLMLQREVCDRIAARAGMSARGFLTVLTESAFEVKKLFDVPPTAFTPMPKVWSAIIELTPKPMTGVDETLFREVVSTAFAQKRKTILNNLKTKFANAARHLDAARIDGRRRAETLTQAEWVNLVESLAAEL